MSEQCDIMRCFSYSEEEENNCEKHGDIKYCSTQIWLKDKEEPSATSPAAMAGSAALPLDETWENFLEWVADYCGGEETAKAASYTREDMRHAFAAGYAKRRGEQ